jgi:predicted DNA-binding protein (MmcQ/YjbR family)
VTHDETKPKPDIARAEAAVAAQAMAYPEATEDNPWGHRAFKVRGKTFLFLSTESSGLSISVKLPESGVLALELPFAEPTGYGLGKSGWVSAKWSAGKDVPLSLVREWLDESYRSIAPKKLSAGVVTWPRGPGKGKRAPTEPQRVARRSRQAAPKRPAPTAKKPAAKRPPERRARAKR